MPYEVEETGTLTRTAQVTVDKNTYDKKLNAALRSIAGNVKMRGFRKGKIPLPVLKQRYGASVTRDVVQDLVSEKVDEVLKEMDNVLHIGVPEVNKIPVGDEKEFAFTFAIELRPKVDPIGFLGLEVEKPKAVIDDEDVDEELEILRERFASNQPVEFRETIAAGDIVTVDFQAIGEHPELQEMQGKDIEIEVGSGKTLPGIEGALEGKGFDAVVESEIEVGEDFPVEEFRGGAVPIRLTVKKVERRVVPELSDDFAQKTGDGETLLELRANIREKLLKSKEKRAESMAETNLLDKLLEQNEIELPPLFLEEQVKRSAERRLQQFRQQGLDPETFGISAEVIAEDIQDDVARQIKEEFLLMEISQKENIDVSEEDVRLFAEEVAENMGVPIEQYMAFMRSNPNQFAQLQATVRLDKTRTHLLEKATIIEVEWPVEEDFDAEDEEEVAGDEGSTEDGASSESPETGEQESADSEESDDKEK